MGWFDLRRSRFSLFFSLIRNRPNHAVKPDCGGPVDTSLVTDACTVVFSFPMTFSPSPIPLLDNCLSWILGISFSPSCANWLWSAHPGVSEPFIKETKAMPSKWPRCGSSLTLKEAIQNWCSSCNRSTPKTASESRRFNSHVGFAVQRNFDLLVADELRKTSLTSAA